MKEKIKTQKGFIPLLIAIIVSIITISTVTTGVVLYKQGKLTPLIASISQVFQKTEEVEPEIKPEEPKTEQEQPLLEKTNQEEISQYQHELEQTKLETEKAKAEAEQLRKETEETKRLEELKRQQETQRLAEEKQKQEEQRQKELEKQGLLFRVVKVIDGDTIKLENGEVVRYVGIDTPETVHPSKPIQCFGKEASDKNKELVEGKLVKLEKDITDRDKYGRLLHYVWVGDLFVNDYLVRQGYAYAYTYPPDVKYSEQFVQAQREAEEANRGLWIVCKETEKDEATCEAKYLDEYQCSGNQLMRMYQKKDCSTEWKSFKFCEYGCENNECQQEICTTGWKCKDTDYRGYQSSNCSWSSLSYCDYGCENGECVVEETSPEEEIICSYNAYNCSDFSTHAEAQGVFEYCGGVTNDIHRLDADKDGLACESLP